MSEPSWDSTTPIAAPVTAQVPASEPTWEGTQDIQDVAGTPAQTALGLGERALQGLISRPGAAYLEKTLSEYGVPGLSPKEQALREEASPWLGGAAEAVGLIAPTVLTGGEAPLYTQAGLLDKIGKGATAVTGLGGKGASLGSRILGKGIAGAAENAAFAAGDVGSQIINGKSPSDAIETAIPYVTLASVIGGAGGLVFGGVPELWSASGAPEKVAQLMNTIKPASALAPEEGDWHLAGQGQYAFRDGVVYGSP